MNTCSIKGKKRESIPPFSALTRIIARQPANEIKYFIDSILCLKVSHTFTAVMDVIPEHDYNVNFAFTPVTPQDIVKAIIMLSSSATSANDRTVTEYFKSISQSYC